jgi:hypothetical protein
VRRVTAFYSALKNLNRRVIFLIMLLAIAFPLVKPMAVGVAATDETKTLYDFIEHLSPGQVVAIANDCDPAWIADLLYSLEAEIYHALKRGLKVVAFSLAAEGPPLTASVFDRVMRDLPQKKYGVDYVNLGFSAGQEAAMAKIGGDIHGAFPVDFGGAPVAQLPIMDSVQTMRDVALLITHNSGGALGVGGWLRQVGVPFGTPIAVAVTGGMYPTHVPYYQSGQVKGLIFGLRGAAEYEGLVGRPGKALGYMGSQNFAAIAVTMFVVVGNMWYLGLKKPGAGSAKKGGA